MIHAMYILERLELTLWIRRARINWSLGDNHKTWLRSTGSNDFLFKSWTNHQNRDLITELDSSSLSMICCYCLKPSTIFATSATLQVRDTWALFGKLIKLKSFLTGRHDHWLIARYSRLYNDMQSILLLNRKLDLCLRRAEHESSLERIWYHDFIQSEALGNEPKPLFLHTFNWKTLVILVSTLGILSWEAWGQFGFLRMQHVLGTDQSGW